MILLVVTVKYLVSCVSWFYSTVPDIRDVFVGSQIAIASSKFILSVIFAGGIISVA